MISATFDDKTVTTYKNSEPITSAPVLLAEAAPEVYLAPSGTWGDA